jgi:ABC-2 type transport system permease protein
MNPFRLGWIHVRMAALNEFQYRANFWVQLLNSAVNLTTGLVAIGLVYQYTAELAGWSRPELLAVMGVHILLGGVVGAFISPNMNQLMEDVQEGTLDYALTRPADSQLMVSVRQVSIWQLIDVVIGMVVLGWSISAVGAGIGLWRALGFVFGLLCGAVIIYCVWLAATTAAFKLIRVDELHQLLDGVYSTGRWPVGVYPGWLRSVLTFLIPLAFAITVPAEVVSVRSGGLVLVWALLATVVAVVVTRLIWRWGIRNYSGASA